MLRGSLLIRGPTSGGFARAAAATTEAEPYYSALVKLFPVEAVTLYPLALGIAGADAALRIGLIVAIGVFVIVLRSFATMDAGNKPDVPAVAVSFVSYGLYAASLGGFGWLPGGQQQTTQVAAFATVIWVALVPYLLKLRRG